MVSFYESFLIGGIFIIRYTLYTLFRDTSAKERKAKKEQEAEIEELYARIGKLTTQNE